MVAKMSSSSTLYGALSYNQVKVEDEHAKVICTNRMIEPANGIYDINTCLRSFEPYLLANNLAHHKTDKTVLHVSINPDPKDALDDEQLSEIAQKYMKKMGYGDQPFIVYKHEDIERKHIHIVSLRVDENGKKIDDRFEHRRSMEVCRALEKEYKLVPADQKQRQSGTPLKAVRYEDGDVKHQIANVIRPIAQTYHFQSLKEYSALLSLHNINVEEVRGEVRGSRFNGLIYSALNNKGEKVGNPIKASTFGKSVGYEAITKRIEKSTEIIKTQHLKTRSKQAITAAMRTTKNRQEFEKTLAKQNIGVLFRVNEKGRIYGATFIDHEQKYVFNGSRLGKEFSANAFNDLFDGKGAEINHNAKQEDAGHATFTQPDSPKEKEWEDNERGLFDTATGGSSVADEKAFERELERKTKKKKKRQVRL
jgi:hypothetical protein